MKKISVPYLFSLRKVVLRKVGNLSMRLKDFDEI